LPEYFVFFFSFNYRFM